MLDSHEELTLPNESLIFKMFSSFLKYYGDLSSLDNQKELLSDILETQIIGYWSPKPDFASIVTRIAKPGLAGVIEALICSTAPHKRLKAWGEKSPGHVFYWDQIKATFPTAKVVHIVRDGRDVAGSCLRARQGPKTYYAAAKMWCAYLDGIERIKRDCRREDLVEIRYEGLLAAPQENLERVCDLLGVTYSDSMLRFFEKDSNYRTDSTNLANLQRPLMTSNSEKWRSKMSVTELTEFESVAREHLVRYDLTPAIDSPVLSAFDELFISRIKSPAIRLLSRARDRQGQMEFLNLRRIKAKRVLSYYLGTD